VPQEFGPEAVPGAEPIPLSLADGEAEPHLVSCFLSYHDALSLSG